MTRGWVVGFRKIRIFLLIIFKLLKFSDYKAPFKNHFDFIGIRYLTLSTERALTIIIVCDPL